MLRSIFIMLSKADWAQRLITRWGFAWRAASRFIAGESPAQAVQAVLELNQSGILATLDHLGEHTDTLLAADQAAQDVFLLLDEINRTGARSNVSVKLSQFGLAIDPEAAYQHLINLLKKAREQSNFITVDMEDSSLTQITLDLVFRAKKEGFDNIGTVIQSYLYRSKLDVEKLSQENIPIRLVKGAYQEPASVAFPRKKDVDKNLDCLSEILLTAAAQQGGRGISSDGRFPPLTALGSHDDRRIEFAQTCAQTLGLDKAALEFQFLYGIRRDLQKTLAQLGYPVRVYVPYGTHWYPYFMRRLAERPANLWFFISNFFHQ